MHDNDAATIKHLIRQLTSEAKLNDQLSTASAQVATLEEKLAAETANNAKLNDQLSTAFAQIAEFDKQSRLLEQRAKVIEEAKRLSRELWEVKETSKDRISELTAMVAHVTKEAAVRFPPTVKLNVPKKLAGEYKLVWIRTDGSFVMTTHLETGNWYVQRIQDFGVNEMILGWSQPCLNPDDCVWEFFN